MFTDGRVDQFLYLLKKIVAFSGEQISIRDAAIFSFFLTSKEYGVEEPTVRDIVRRHQKKTYSTEQFYEAINDAYSGNTMTFKGMYFSFIPRHRQKEFESVLTGYSNSEIKPSAESNRLFADCMKHWKNASDEERASMLKKLKESTTDGG